MAIRLATNLGLNPEERENFLEDFSRPRRKDNQYRNQNALKRQSRELTSKQFDVIADPIHYTILSLMDTDDFKSDTQWIASRLGCSEAKIKSSLRNLFELGLIDLDEQREIIRTKHSLSTTEDIADPSIKRAHLADLDAIREKINLDVELRDFCSYTFPADPNLLSRAKEIIRRAQDEIESLMQEEGKAKEVYKISSYFYPLTKIQKSNKETGVLK